MTQNGLPAGPPSGVFSAAEKDFFQQGELLEREELALDELTDRPRRLPRAWRPGLILAGVAVGASLLVLSLVGGRKPSGEVVAAVRIAPAAAAPLAPESATAAPAPAPAPRVPPLKAKRIKHAHHHQAARGNHR